MSEPHTGLAPCESPGELLARIATQALGKKQFIAYAGRLFPSFSYANLGIVYDMSQHLEKTYEETDSGDNAPIDLVDDGYIPS